MNSYNMKKVNKWLDKRKIYDIRLIYFLESFSFVIWPMILACDDNELDACKYMYENGAADHIHKIDEVYGYNTMIISCLSGNLEICKWLKIYFYLIILEELQCILHVIIIIYQFVNGYLKMVLFLTKTI